jgi:hypothetical protein
VKAIETSRSGDWMCIIEYQDRRQPRQGMRLYRSHLWIKDIGRFEIVTRGSIRSDRKPIAAAVADLQLRLPFPSE